MRKSTLAGIAYLLTVITVYGVAFVFRISGLEWQIPGPVAQLTSALLLAPLMLIPLSKLNRHLLAWRKKKGRDIEEEERYENMAAGLISLQPARAEKDGL